jgi:hypothetical protein
VRVSVAFDKTFGRSHRGLYFARCGRRRAQARCAIQALRGGASPVTQHPQTAGWPRLSAMGRSVSPCESGYRAGRARAYGSWAFEPVTDRRGRQRGRRGLPGSLFRAWWGARSPLGAPHCLGGPAVGPRWLGSQPQESVGRYGLRLPRRRTAVVPTLVPHKRGRALGSLGAGVGPFGATPTTGQCGAARWSMVGRFGC